MPGIENLVLEVLQSTYPLVFMGLLARVGLKILGGG